MKIKYLFLSLLLLSLSKTKAQTYRSFKVILSGGYAIPSGEIKGGFISSIEAQYLLNDNWGIGLSSGSANLGEDGIIMRPDQIFLGTANTYCLTGTYFINKKNIRPFINIATGLGLVDTYSLATDFKTKSKFAIVPGIGLEGSHVRLTTEFNFIGKVESINCNYLGLKVGAYFGGGKK